MSAKQSKRPGRPATGITKAKPSVTLDAKLVAKVKKQACRENISFSQYVERAVATYFKSKEGDAQ